MNLLHPIIPTVTDRRYPEDGIIKTFTEYQAGEEGDIWWLRESSSLNELMEDN